MTVNKKDVLLYTLCIYIYIHVLLYHIQIKSSLQETQNRAHRSRHMRVHESRHIKAHTWEPTYESRHMRAHIWEHTYESKHMRAYTYESTHMIAHMWEHKAEHTCESTKQSTQMRAQRRAHIRAHIWKHTYERTEESTHMSLRSPKAQGHVTRAILCWNLEEKWHTLVPGPGWTPRLNTGPVTLTVLWLCIGIIIV